MVVLVVAAGCGVGDDLRLSPHPGDQATVLAGAQEADAGELTSDTSIGATSPPGSVGGVDPESSTGPRPGPGTPESESGSGSGSAEQDASSKGPGPTPASEHPTSEPAGGPQGRSPSSATGTSSAPDGGAGGSSTSSSGSSSSSGQTGSTPSSPADPPPTVGDTAGSLFVAPDGTGDGRSAGSPLGSIEEAFEAAQPGDVIVVGGGRYHEDVTVVFPAAGTTQNPIRVRAAEGERPVIQGLVRLSGLRHWTISGLNVTWPDHGTNNQHLVKLTGGEHWTFANAEVWGARSFAAILVAGTPTDYRLSGLHVHDTAPANGRNQDHLIYLNSGTGTGVVERCLLVGSPNGRAIKVGPAASDGPAVANITIRYNTMVDNQGPSNVQLSGPTSNVTIHHNLLVQPQPGRNAVTVFELGGSGNLVRDNVAWQAAGVADRDPGVGDGGGNTLLDPRFAPGTYRPTDPAAAGFGYLAS